MGASAAPARTATQNPMTGTQRFVSVDFRGDGGRKWEQLTGAAAGKVLRSGDKLFRFALAPSSLVAGRPEMVVEVAFAGWTPDARLRHASFKGVREDKPPKEVIRESPTRLTGAGPAPCPPRW